MGLPVVLQLEGIECLIIGEGREADSKAAMFERAGATVTRAAGYVPGTLGRYRIVVAALEDRSYNPEIRAETRRSGALVNCIDDPAHCDFYFASIVEQGELQLAISTGGACPALAVRIRERLEREFGPEYAEFLAIARELREELAIRIPDFAQRKAIWYRLVDSEALALLKAGRAADARAVLKALIDAAALT